MTNEELDFLFDLLRDKKTFEESLKPNKYRVFNLSLDTNVGQNNSEKI